MQMSIERFRDVHKLIWNTVIGHASEVSSRETSVYFLKQVGIETAYNKGMIDLDESIVIMRHNRCLLCAEFEYCELCPLGDCNMLSSAYRNACHGDVNAMIEIRDIVDKKPFTELSIITLYNEEDE